MGIFLSPETKLLYAFRDPAAYDEQAKQIVSLFDSKYPRLLVDRNLASDHFLQGVVTIDPTQSE